MFALGLCQSFKFILDSSEESLKALDDKAKKETYRKNAEIWR